MSVTKEEFNIEHLTKNKRRENKEKVIHYSDDSEDNFQSIPKATARHNSLFFPSSKDKIISLHLEATGCYRERK
jgi:hypothetical protein